MLVITSLYIYKYIIYILTLFCLLTSILGCDSNREITFLWNEMIIWEFSYLNACINAISPFYIYIYIIFNTK